MGLAYENLDDETRRLMIQEIDRDVGDNTIYISNYFQDDAKDAWIELLNQAANQSDDDWLIYSVETGGLLKTHTLRANAKKGFIQVKVPHTAAMNISEGQFNQFYIRALCVRADAEGFDLEVYRAKAVENPRDDAYPIGSKVDPLQLLEELRENKGAGSTIAQPNSGRSVRLVKKQS